MRIFFLDMDLTVAKFPIQHGEQGTKKYRLDTGFFCELQPYANVEQVNKAIQTKKASGVYILSNSPTEQADADKDIWLDKYLPAIPQENRIFNRGGLYAVKTKAAVAMEFLGRPLTKDDILVDDCPKNCAEWVKAGGTAIRKRRRNDGIQWQGKSLYRMTTLANLIQSA